MGIGLVVGDRDGRHDAVAHGGDGGVCTHHDLHDLLVGVEGTGRVRVNGEFVDHSGIEMDFRRDEPVVGLLLGCGSIIAHLMVVLLRDQTAPLCWRIVAEDRDAVVVGDDGGFGIQSVTISGGTPTGISNLEASASAKSSTLYNLAGQQVSESYKGIVVKNGKKYLNK